MTSTIHVSESYSESKLHMGKVPALTVSIGVVFGLLASGIAAAMLTRTSKRTSKRDATELAVLRAKLRLLDLKPVR